MTPEDPRESAWRGEPYAWQGQGPQFDPATGKPRFDEVFARQLMGKYVLVGFSYYSDADDAEHRQFLEQRQFHGDVIRVSEREGLVLRLRNSGEEMKLPPDFRPFIKARPGSYTLSSTKEVVYDPDYVCTWCMHKKATP